MLTCAKVNKSILSCPAGPATAQVWLHRGTYAYAEDLAQGKATTKCVALRGAAAHSRSRVDTRDRYINYALQRVRMLRHFGVVPVLVFDGGPLPSKAGTELERERYVLSSVAPTALYMSS